ncbi:MAG: hypothetical protein US40_C0016G0014 [Candidatus Roizmanbacteria bacterium GW2011_GWC2_37_13]|uniref:Uncharacterized protein n=1 Tax=Candidatus Roizmanbacteria bacterium GW2011_GWC2_37_13 TaxID=1618486 RepID=A0A0G0G344_9BACT|nr:MAG: hypothetical protein US38_C0017G0011 [Candidatus Roizmanbacteria bacterium GW2011_GWC1_37_12]KKQ24452.1 MAG: hypothetical protein US40_C0016G0014 [Candidatus Roizmanbacteria bacterium GW2011_GWC2_37_13]
MNTPNIKIYLAVSGVLIILFLIVTFVPFGKKSTSNQPPTTNFPTPTSVEINQIPDTSNQSPMVESVDFTGAAEEELPPEVMDAALQKQDLRNKTLFDTGLFQIDFDYGEDKFVVILAEPKGENRQQFNQWLKDNYPSLNVNQFNFK